MRPAFLISHVLIMSISFGNLGLGSCEIHVVSCTSIANLCVGGAGYLCLAVKKPRQEKAM
jgi:hypothetical protein